MKFTDHSLVFTFQHLSVTLYVFCRGATIFNDPDHAGQTRGGTESDSRRTWKYVLTLQNKMESKIFDSQICITPDVLAILVNPKIS